MVCSYDIMLLSTLAVVVRRELGFDSGDRSVSLSVSAPGDQSASQMKGRACRRFAPIRRRSS